MYILIKIKSKIRDIGTSALFKSPFKLHSNKPFISFTFDDAPKSAFASAGRLMEEKGISGTFYISFSLLNKDSESGPIMDSDDLKKALYSGHELGCHTYSHIDTYNSTPSKFEASLRKNQNYLNELIPGMHFKTFAYPYGNVTPSSKRIVGKHYVCGRGGGQRFNVGTIDLNLLHACFIDRLHGINRPSMEETKALIDGNRKSCGWLIFVTHDVQENHSRYGCTPDFFEEVLRYAIKSDAMILPVVKVCEVLGMVKPDTTTV